MANTSWASVVADTRENGNRLAVLFAVAPGDASVFNRALEIYSNTAVLNVSINGSGLEVLSSSELPVGYYIGTSLSPGSMLLAQEFTSAGPYPLLEQRGGTLEEITYLKAHVQFDLGDRTLKESQWKLFVESLGLQVPLALTPV